MIGMADCGVIEAPAQDLAAATGRLFPLPVTVAVLRCDPVAQAEYGSEALSAAPMIAARRAEFLTGRRALRQALSGQGIRPGAIPMGRDREPVLPKGTAASLSHANGFCVAVASRVTDALGVDIEGARPLSAELWEHVLTPADHAHIADMPAQRRGIAALQIFSCKEALYKAQFPLTGQMIGFDTVDIALAGATFTARFRRDVGPFGKGARVAGRTTLAGRFVLSGIALEV